MSNNPKIPFSFKKLTSRNYSVLKDELLELYLQAFTTGEYAQYVSRKDASWKLDEIQSNGSGVAACSTENPQVH